MGFHPTGDEWKEHHAFEKKLYANCAICGRSGLKMDSFTIFVKPPSSTMRTWCHVCEDCMAELADKLQTPIP